MGRLGGTHKHTIDKKKRMFLPSKIRENIGETFIVTKSLSAKCIALYPEEVWKDFEEALNALPRVAGDPIKRKIFSSMEEMSVDSQGRILLPTELCEYAGLEKNVVVIGVGDHAEIWSDVRRAEAEEGENSPELLEQIISLGL